MTPRQTDQNLDALVARFHEKQIAMEQIAFKERFHIAIFHVLHTTHVLVMLS